MQRRHFLSGIASLVGGIALERAIPFNRVWSFPSNIVVMRPIDLVSGKGIPVAFIRAYDDYQARLVHTFDMLYGFPRIRYKATNIIGE